MLDRLHGRVHRQSTALPLAAHARLEGSGLVVLILPLVELLLRLVRVKLLSNSRLRRVGHASAERACGSWVLLMRRHVAGASLVEGTGRSLVFVLPLRV